MGIDWEEILGVEGEEIADEYEDKVYDAMQEEWSDDQMNEEDIFSDEDTFDEEEMFDPDEYDFDYDEELYDEFAKSKEGEADNRTDILDIEETQEAATTLPSEKEKTDEEKTALSYPEIEDDEVPFE